MAAVQLRQELDRGRAVSTSASPAARSISPGQAREATLLDLLDRLLEGGVAIHGEITLAVADVDLLRLSLRVLLGAVDTLEGTGSSDPDGSD
jgi:hypothetical protein